ncbi:hypothetical protein KAR91_08785 [Candidatus Pacearchaeota archaeon]|nr:hypothetical protein [Candidatus Pacearchaeota archaeon]
MPKQLTTSLSKTANNPLSDLVYDLFNYGVDGNIISGGMLGNTTPNPYAESADQLATIGSKLRLKDGREFMYCQDGGAGIGVALMGQAEAATDKWYDQLQTGHGWTAGDTSNTCLITTAATPVINEWAQGWMFVNKGTGLGYNYRILTNTSHATIVTVTIEDPVVEDIPAASELTFIKSNFKDTIVVATGGLTAIAIGVPLIPITASYYYWSQIKGPAPLTVDTGETITIGMPVTHPATCAVAGACGPCVTLENRYGNVMRVGAEDEIALVNLDLGL